MTICKFSAVALAEWDSEKERANGYTATVKATASSRHVRIPAHSLCMVYGSYFSTGKTIAQTTQSAKIEC
jgi:hypothetical protein